MNLDSSMMGALRCFEVAGTHKSFTKAAHTLNLTQSAVSQQIRNLEERLGYPLFVRLARGLALTPKGEVLLKCISNALQDIQSTLEQLSQEDGEIRVSCLPSFALHWLMPRLAAFYRKHRLLSIRMNAAFDTIDAAVLAKENIDIAIRYDDEQHAGLNPVALMEEYLFPVATPEYISLHPSLLEGRFDADVQFLHDSSPWAGAPSFIEWRQWLLEHRPDLLSRQAGPQFNLSSLAIAAALNHQGIAIGRSALVLDEIEQGRLICVTGKYVVSPARYVLIEGPTRKHQAGNFARWIVQECQMFAARRQSLLGSSQIVEKES